MKYWQPHGLRKDMHSVSIEGTKTTGRQSILWMGRPWMEMDGCEQQRGAGSGARGRHSRHSSPVHQFFGGDILGVETMERRFKDSVPFLLVDVYFF